MAPPVQSREGTPDYERWRAERRQDVFWGFSRRPGRKTQVGKRPESYPHSTRWLEVPVKRRIRNSTGSAMAYVRFSQILYSANGTTGPAGPKIKLRK